jgi:predicted nucleic acid-binding protein
MRIALDSNRYTDFASGDERAVQVIQNAAEIYVPLIVLAELRAGFAFGSRRQKNESVLTRFLNTDGVQVISPDEQTTFFYADLYADFRKRGRPIPTHDIWIAALCLQHRLILFGRDADFDHVPQLARL